MNYGRRCGCEFGRDCTKTTEFERLSSMMLENGHWTKEQYVKAVDDFLQGKMCHVQSAVEDCEEEIKNAFKAGYIQGFVEWGSSIQKDAVLDERAEEAWEYHKGG